MATKIYLVLALVLATVFNVQSGDPDITSDFVLPNGVTPDGSFFTFKGLKQSLMGSPANASFKVTKASQVEFPALVGQSVSYASLQFSPQSINAPHTHLRSAELFLVLKGSVEVGLIDSNSKLFTQVLKTGEMFVFPRGLVHFQVNRDSKKSEVAVSAFGSANAGTVALPMALFGSGIDREVLAKSFKTDTETIEKLTDLFTMKK